MLGGGAVITVGHLILAVDLRGAFYAGRALVTIGTGLLKLNVSILVGSLYESNEARRDSGFSLFYMGITLGAFLGPIVAGWTERPLQSGRGPGFHSPLNPPPRRVPMDTCDLPRLVRLLVFDLSATSSSVHND